MRDILIFDIETDSSNVDEAELKWFGAYSYKDDKHYLLDYNELSEIEDLISRHKVLVGFNNKSFDQPIIEKKFEDDIFNYKIIIDLFEISAPKGSGGFGTYNKNRLVQMGYKLKNYSLKNIINKLKLDEKSKGDIDYNIFRKNKWNKEEIKEIKKYLKQDIDITKKLFEWYEKQFKPLEKLLPSESRRKFVHLKSSLSSLGYQIICNKAGIPVEWDDSKSKSTKSFTGAHHINPRWNLEKGNIIEIDFTSAYPHALMMGNLYSPSKDGWNGDGYFNVQGTYNNKKLGKIEMALKEIFEERLKAKKNKDKTKNLSYKIVINSIYGLTGNRVFKSIYNPTTASDCTLIVRTWLKKLAKTLEENGFICLYGFTDSIFIKIPNESNKEELMLVVNKFINKVKENVPFPMDTFGMEVEEELKMIWFVAKNCYLFVTNDGGVKYKSTLLNTNTPKVIMKVFENYMKPKIIKELDVNFTQTKLLEEIKKLISKDIELAAEEYRVGDKSNYKVKTSIHYQISDKYGEGSHFLIPNTKNVGVGRSKSTKKTNAVRYCSIEDFKKKKLKVEDIDLKKLISHIKPFIRKSEQTTLK